MSDPLPPSLPRRIVPFDGDDLPDGIVGTLGAALFLLLGMFAAAAAIASGALFGIEIMQRLL